MRKFTNLIGYIGVLSFMLLFISCVSFKPGWNEYQEKVSAEDIELLFDEARKIEASAATAEELISLIEVLKKIEKTDPYHYQALWTIGHYYMLMGAAYAEDKKEKSSYYREAIQYCERAMCANEEFLAAIEGGADITDAIHFLTIDEIDAMGYWYTARFYYFKECMSPFKRAMNTRIVMDNNKMIDRIDELDSNWAGGGNYFSRALYYIAVPERFGGSIEVARDEFSKAIEAGPDYLVNRWGRAKYLHQLTGDNQAFKSDLEWVLAQDPNMAPNTYPWNVYFQRDAQKMLDHLE